MELGMTIYMTLGILFMLLIRLVILRRPIQIHAWVLGILLWLPIVLTSIVTVDRRSK